MANWSHFMLFTTYCTMLCNKYLINNAFIMYGKFELVRTDLRIFDGIIFLKIITYVKFHFAVISISNALHHWQFDH